jgi:hypothetical protein
MIKRAMTSMWWDQGSVAKNVFPTLIAADDSLVALGAPDLEDDVRDILEDPKKLADLMLYYFRRPYTPNVCFAAGVCYSIMYLGATQQASLYDMVRIVLDRGEHALVQGAGPTMIKSMMLHYARALDVCTRVWTEAKEEARLGGLAASLRASCHAIYGFHAAVNTWIILSGKLPVSASAYVNIKKGLVGPTMHHSFFLGPDGEADPETLLFAPALNVFVQPLDVIVSNVLKEAIDHSPSSPNEELRKNMDMSSPVNRTFRKKNARPRLERPPSDLFLVKVSDDESELSLGDE